MFPEKPEVVIEEYKEGIKRTDSCSDMGSVKSEASKTKSAEAKDSDVTLEEIKAEIASGKQEVDEELKVESSETESKANIIVDKVDIEEEPESNVTQDTV